MSNSNIQTQLPSKNNSLPINQIKSNFAKYANKVSPSPFQENNFLQDLEDLPQNTTLEFTPRKYQVNNLFQEEIISKGKENQPRFLSPLQISVSRTRSSSQPKDADLAANQSDSSRAVSPVRKNIINLSENGREPGSEIRVFGVPSDNAITTPKSQSDLAQSGGNILHLSQMYTFDKVTKESQGNEYSSQNELPEIMETAANENGDWDGKPENKYIETPSTSHHKVPKWKKLKSVLQSLVLFQTQEVRKMNNAVAISQEIDSFALRTSNITPISKEKKLKDQNDPLTLLRRVEEFCECAAIGSSDHIAHMKYLIKKDPKKFMLSTEDPLHFINSLNTKGQSALYIAAKNGNAEVVKLLIENNVNHLIKSKVNSNGFYEETALEVATRWGHQTIINMLLQHYKFEDKVVKGCLKMAPNSNVKAQIKEYMKQNKIKSRGGFFFVCSKY